MHNRETLAEAAGYAERLAELCRAPDETEAWWEEVGALMTRFGRAMKDCPPPPEFREEAHRGARTG